MVYLIVDSERRLKSMLIKATEYEELRNRVSLYETQYIAGTFSDIDLQNLIANRCIVISS